MRTRGRHQNYLALHDGGYGSEALSEDRISGGASCSTLSSPTGRCRVSIWFHNARPVNQKWPFSGFQMALESALQIPNKITTRPEESLFSAGTDMCLEYAEVLCEGRYHEIPHAISGILYLCLYSDWPRGHSVHLCIFFLYMLYPIDFTLHKLPTSEILVFLKCWFFSASFASICLDSG